ncbi:MAG: hypothetical protein ABI042_13570 [Verrucomicrobiota bacterium]
MITGLFTGSKLYERELLLSYFDFRPATAPNDLSCFENYATWVIILFAGR